MHPSHPRLVASHSCGRASSLPPTESHRPTATPSQPNPTITAPIAPGVWHARPGLLLSRAHVHPRVAHARYLHPAAPAFALYQTPRPPPTHTPERPALRFHAFNSAAHAPSRVSTARSLPTPCRAHVRPRAASLPALRFHHSSGAAHSPSHIRTARSLPTPGRAHVRPAHQPYVFMPVVRPLTHQPCVRAARLLRGRRISPARTSRQPRPHPRVSNLAAAAVPLR